ncbi:Calcineurin-like phosphoesterase [Mariprofundus aestuarium]|uniref:Calcineurin-like phosphoesterase n=1 Tax=Mariprofundus aestuarium TaxID=1921086 RepID=A0A2K8KWA0_MARES|nr:metallophosphoesterase [Mariprofundus aestuarium]ATX79137.1 Calcineurin-like phosphoesterase [Mariprofundus aestuarium]
MKVQVLSDLHLECAPFEPRLTDADVIILAGDVGDGCAGILWAQKVFSVHVIYVCGNHEFHNSDYSMKEHIAEMKNIADGSNVHLLDNDSIVISGVRFLGSTMWTDLRHFGSVLHCDYDQIIMSHEPGCIPSHFSVGHQQALFDTNREWLANELSQIHIGNTVVISHHAPSQKSIHPRYVGHPWNSCFVTNLEDLMDNSVDLWIHGHTHSNCDYMINNTRVVCNPRGYPMEVGWENADFDPECLVRL